MLGRATPLGHGAWPLVLVALVLSPSVFVSCDDPSPRIGLTKSSEGLLMILFKPCREENGVRSLTLSSESTSDSDVLWEIASEGTHVRQFVVGETPHGFTSTTPLADAGSLEGRMRVTIEWDGVTNSETFLMDEVSADGVLVPRLGTVTKQEFWQRDTCD